MAATRRGAARLGAEHVAMLLLLVTTCAGFAAHKRHPHHHNRHHGHNPHHPLSLDVPAAPGAAEAAGTAATPDPSPPTTAPSHDVLLEALRAAELGDAAWGSVDGEAAAEAEAGVPLFVKMLLRDTEEGAIFAEHSRPVAPATPGTSSKKTLASCRQPSRVSVGRTGAMVVEFPGDTDADDAMSGRWLVLSAQAGGSTHAVVDVPSTLSVYLAQDAGHTLQLLAEHPLPNATFMAVDVSAAMARSTGPWLRFVVDVTPSPAAAAAALRGVSAATVLEVAGWERGPLLVSAQDWGGDRGAATGTGGAIRVWEAVPEDVLHPPRPRSRRRSHHDRSTTTTTTTTERPSNSSARHGWPGPADGDSEDKDCCHLEAWTVSLADLGWNFIVAPRTLDINFCVGRCPRLLLDNRFNASTNAIARTAIKATRGAEAGANIPDAQCVPTRYRPIVLIMQDKGRVDLFSSNDLSADRCGCR